MTDQDKPQADAWRSLLDPPYSLDLLADLHAGALDDALAARLSPLANADRDASLVLDALDATVRQLKEQAAHTPSVPVPAGVASRIDDALAAQPLPTRQPRPPTNVAAARARRHRTSYLGIGVLAAAAAAAGVFALSVGLGSHDLSGTPRADGPQAPARAGAAPSTAMSSTTATPLDLGSGAPGPKALTAIGKEDLGPLSDKAALDGCLQANGIAPTSQVIGASQVTLNGQRGILLLLPTGRAAMFTALVVGPECSAQNAATRSRVEIGAR
ncbi:MAG: hypothetical protein ACXVXI_03585 [Mycobacteriaceae bacterium]